MKIAVSVTAHENYSVLVDQIKNIFHFIKEPILVIHINKDSEDLYMEVKKNLESIRNNISKNIFIIENRVSTGKKDYSLDIAHLNNYYFLINNNVKFDYFLLEASNSLFIRSGIEEFIKDYDAGNYLRLIENSNTEYWTQRVFSHETYKIFCKRMLLNNTDNIYKSTHEGSFYNAEIADKVFSIVKNIRELCVLFDDLPNYPTEEYWFSLALKKIINDRKGIRLHHPLTYMPWNQNLFWSINDVNTFLDNPKDFFSIKRIERKYDDDVRSFIRDKFGY